MDIDSSRIQELISRPGESLSVEVKAWIDPDAPDGISKIVRAALALRNHGGGYLVIGFDNHTLQPDEKNVPADVKSAFHIDKIQGLISRFASEPFEVAVNFPERNGQIYPVIVISPGVETPVASKSDLLLVDKTKLISTDDVYVRSLRSNNTPSTTKASWKDWPELVKVCFDNREADIGRFLRRHLNGISPATLREVVSTISKVTEPEIPIKEHLQRYLQESSERFKEVVRERALELPGHGVWEVALLLVGDIPAHSANIQFLNLIESSNPGYTGWPVWLDSRAFNDANARPYVVNGVWESLVVSFERGLSNHLDFMRLDPKGRFYLRRALQDDLGGSPHAPEPLTVLDFGLPIVRTAEAIAVGIAFAKAMRCAPEKTLLAFAFRWTRLRGRQISSWAQPSRFLFGGRRAYQDEVLTFVDVPLETSLSALDEYVNHVVQPLFEAFEGFTLDKTIVEDLSRRVIERRL